MKSLLVIAVVVFVSVFDLLFYGGHRVHAVLTWVQTNADWVNDQIRALFD